MAEAERLAWVKKAVCDGLNLDGSHFDALVKHKDGAKLRAFLQEAPTSSESWLLFHAGTEADAPDVAPVAQAAAPAADPASR